MDKTPFLLSLLFVGITGSHFVHPIFNLLLDHRFENSEDFKSLRDLTNTTIPMDAPVINWPINKSLSINTPSTKVNASIISNLVIGNISVGIDQNEDSIVKLIITNLSFKGNYDITGIVKYILPLQGGGNFSITFKNLLLQIDANIVPLSGILWIKKLELHLTDPEDLDVEINGLTGDKEIDDVTKYFIKDLVPVFLKHYKEQLEDIITDLLMKQTHFGKLNFENLVVSLKSLI